MTTRRELAPGGTVCIDGSEGEGGGQIVRSSLGLSLVTGRPVQLTRIRAGRGKPGLLRQHLTAVRAAQAVGAATVEGATLRSSALTFEPTALLAGDYELDIGSAGSTTLVLQTVLPALLLADGSSTLTVQGGTHNPMAPPAEFLVRSFAPLLARMGGDLEITVDPPGFFPAGGGCLKAVVRPADDGLRPLELLDRGALLGQRASALSYALPGHVARRELARVQEVLGWSGDALTVVHPRRGRGPGNALSLELMYEHVTYVATSFGERGRRAERVADTAAKDVLRYLETPAPVGEHLADQLLIPLALARGGRFRTLEPTLHTRTNAAIIERFLDVRFQFEQHGHDDWVVTVSEC